jgi:hypothetical protein
MFPCGDASCALSPNQQRRRFARVVVTGQQYPATNNAALSRRFDSGRALRQNRRPVGPPVLLMRHPRSGAARLVGVGLRCHVFHVHMPPRCLRHGGPGRGAMGSDTEALVKSLLAGLVDSPLRKCRSRDRYCQDRSRAEKFEIGHCGLLHVTDPVRPTARGLYQGDSNPARDIPDARNRERSLELAVSPRSLPALETVREPVAHVASQTRPMAACAREYIIASMNMHFWANRAACRPGRQATG